MHKKLLVISIDSMINEDLELMTAFPAFRELLEQSSIVHGMTATYPTLTHSVHTSMLTGCYPERHGVIHNEQFFPLESRMPWFEDASLCRVRTLPEYARQAGYSTAYVYWPVTLGAPVEWNLHRGGIHAKPEDLQAILRQRATPGLFDEVYPHVRACFEEPDHYRMDDSFCCGAVSYLIRQHQPDIIYTHLVLIDHIRHIHGVHSDHLRSAYAFLDQGLGKILQALKDSGLYDQTLIALCSDHGHLDIERVVSLNRFFQDHGLQRADETGRVLEYDAYCHSGSLSAQIYLREDRPELFQTVWSLLWDNRELLGIRELLTKDVCRQRYHTDGGYAFMAETDGRTSFSAMPHFPLITPTDNSDYRTSRATHGHQPERGPQPIFALRNPFSTSRVSLAHGQIVDEAPTLARLMGFSMPDCDGMEIPEFVS